MYVILRDNWMRLLRNEYFLSYKSVNIMLCIYTAFVAE